MSPPSKPSRALLTMGDYGGTLAAARLLGRKNVRVALAEYRVWVPARFSRFVSEVLLCPPSGEWSRYLDWLLDYGAAHPGAFLYPTSDDTAWLYAQHAARLAPYFQLYQPPVAVIYRLLNKKHLSDVCTRLGIATPRTFFPQSEADCRRYAAQLKTPYLLKPRTQIGLKVGHKGKVVNAACDAWKEYAAFHEQLVYQPQLLLADPDVVWPMMQEYYAGAMQSIISIAGFVDRSGHIAARSSRKVLQRPRRLGVGLCFQSLDVDPLLLEQLGNLCRELGYFGVFEAEFIEDDSAGQRLLIDFNPRYYGQMGFEIARDLPLPYFALLGASGRESELPHALALARDAASGATYIYATRWLLHFSLLTGWLGRQHVWADLKRWRSWLKDPRHIYTDAVYAADDAKPYLVDIVLNVSRYLRHPRDFFRKFFLDT